MTLLLDAWVLRINAICEIFFLKMGRRQSELGHKLLNMKIKKCNEIGQLSLSRFIGAYGLLRVQSIWKRLTKWYNIIFICQISITIQQKEI